MFHKRKYHDLHYSYSAKKKKENDQESENNEPSLENPLSILFGGREKKSKDNKIEREYNHIYFYSEVDRESIFDLITLIKEAEEECFLTSYKLHISEIPIYLHISSFGGSIFAAFTAIDVIKACRVPVYTIIEGSTASAGTLISIVGKKRYITPNSFMLIHQLSSGCWGKMHEIEDEFKNLEQLMNRIMDMYKEYANIPKKELTELLKHDLWLNNEKCLKYGLVDDIWQ
jgi:ATP-dependent Clp endopeptidase proteolytic subunit ClpP